MTLNAVEFFTEEFLHAVRVPLEDAEFFSNVPVIVQQLQYRIRASHILQYTTTIQDFQLEFNEFQRQEKPTITNKLIITHTKDRLFLL